MNENKELLEQELKKLMHHLKWIFGSILLTFKMII